jgi:hypothetical protein
VEERPHAALAVVPPRIFHDDRPFPFKVAHQLEG